MQTTRKISDDIVYIGASDRKVDLFENVLPIRNGVAYNNYLVLDEQTTLFDTADHCVGIQFFENLKAALDGRKLDYVVVHHMEPDHASSLEELTMRYPEVKIVTNDKVVKMIGQFFDFPLEGRVQLVKEGDTLCTGRHTFTFVMAPFVHWPEVMMTYDTSSKTLFSADAFGSFGALCGNIFADELNYSSEWLDDMRRYYCNIVGKYGTQVQNTLKKAAPLEINTICPLHGPLLRTPEDIAFILEKYQRWSSYQPEEQAVAIFYGSMYGHTENACEVLANLLANRGVRNIKMHDVARTDETLLIAEAFRVSHLVLAAPTYTNALFGPMESFLLDLKNHDLKGRTFALIENGTWAPTSGKLMRNILEDFKETTLLENTITLKSSLKETAALEALADEIAKTL